MWTWLGRAGGRWSAAFTSLQVLTDALNRVRRDRSAQLVTLVGVPGIGKSRLVAELFETVDRDPSHVVLWRQGRSLPYGEGVTFWALAEMVKAQAGILETDGHEDAEAKLRAAVEALIPDADDAQWIAGHLRALAGLSTGTEPAGDRREEAFTAWRRFFEALSEQNPLVLVFEDLHWADDNLLDFVEHLVDWGSSAPMLVVCNTRPELFERRPGWAGTTRNAIRLSLAPLSDDETARLITSLSEQPVMSLETQQLLLSRAGGNPLYAEQYVRMLAERPHVEDFPVPETIQGIIAARLDALSIDDKLLLQDAAVHGKVFWLGAVTGGVDRRAAEVRLHSLERKDFVQRARRSSVANEVEYAFMHVLVRDVAYGQIPRGERAEKHRQAAEWLASLGRTEDHAEMLAHHYASALELTRAAGHSIDVAFAERALETLRDAGDRAYSLTAYATAAGFYASALELADPGSLERARLLFALGRSRHIAGDSDEELLATASADLLECGDPETAAEAETALTELTWLRGDADEAIRHLDRARQLVEGRDTSRVKAYVVSTVSRYLMLAGRSEESIRVGREALAMAEQLGLDEVRANALNNIGAARCQSGDPGGMVDLEDAIAVADRANIARENGRARANLASVLWMRGSLDRSAAISEEARIAAERFGQHLLVRWVRASRARDEYARGRWREAAVCVETFLSEVEAGSPHYLASDCYMIRASIRFGQDDVDGSLRDAEHSLQLARLARDPQALYPILAKSAYIFSEIGDWDRAAALAGEMVEQLSIGRVSSALVADSLHELAWTLSRIGRAAELLAILPAENLPWVRAASAYAEGNLRASADVCAEMGARTEEARDRLWLAESLVDQQRRAEADVELQQALAFYRSVGATRYIRAGESLLAASA